MGKRIQKILLREVGKETLNLGYSGENEHTEITINCAEVYTDYPDAIVQMIVKPPSGDQYLAVITYTGGLVKWDVTASDVANSGSGSYQLIFTDDGTEIFRSAIGKTQVMASLDDTTGDAPSPAETFAAAVASELAGQIADAVDERIGKKYDGLILAPYASVTDANRYGEYSSLEEVGTAFGTTSEPYLAAQAYFAADPAPSRLCMCLYMTSEMPLIVLRDLVAAGNAWGKRVDDFIFVALAATASAKLNPYIESVPPERLISFVPVVGAGMITTSSDPAARAMESDAASHLFTIYHDNSAYVAAAIMGMIIGALENGDTIDSTFFATHSIAGLNSYSLTSEQETALAAKNCNYITWTGNEGHISGSGTMADGTSYDTAIAAENKIVDGPVLRLNSTGALTGDVTLTSTQLQALLGLLQ